MTSGPVSAYLRETFIEVHHFNLARRYDLLQEPLCSLCSAPLSGDEEGADPNLCWICTYYDDLYGFEQAFAMSPYVKGKKSDLQKDIHQKYYGKKPGSRRLGVALALFVNERLPALRDAEAIVPAPIHSETLAERGFNQSEFIAEEVGGLLGIPVRADVLQKIRKGAQMELSSREERRENVRGMYTYRPFDKPPRLVLLIDDIMASGFTAAECSQQIVNAGAQSVYALVAGRNVFVEGE
ncbi:MAG: ComF family protein [bacterium]